MKEIPLPKREPERECTPQEGVEGDYTPKEGEGDSTLQEGVSEEITLPKRESKENPLPMREKEDATPQEGSDLISLVNVIRRRVSSSLSSLQSQTEATTLTQEATAINIVNKFKSSMDILGRCAKSVLLAASTDLHSTPNLVQQPLLSLASGIEHLLSSDKESIPQHSLSWDSDGWLSQQTNHSD
ncbi:hypothetical protein OTU49_009467 [Cherax quadricarinatus]|uniref:Uncharacterized protein n=1 Tax=Cherax quadricarinatus TaxID=27406 RepID=A0AAW0WKN4_CHEQU